MARKLVPTKKTRKEVTMQADEEEFFDKLFADMDKTGVPDMTNLELVIRVVKATKGCSNIKELDCVKEELDELGKRFKTNRNEAFLLAACMEWISGTTLSGLRGFLTCSHLEAMLFLEDFEALVKRRYMKKVGFDEEMFLYELMPCVIKAMKDNSPFKVDKVKKLDNSEFWKAVGEIYSRDEFHLFSASYELKTLLAEQEHQPLAKVCNQEGLTDESALLLAWACWQRTCKSIICLENEHLWKYDDDCVLNNAFRETITGKSDLVQKHLMEAYNDCGMASNKSISLTASAVQDLLGEEYQNSQKDIFIKGLVKSDTISAKELFYNDEEDAVVQKIVRTLDDENFKQIQQRMKDASFRISYPILLFGVPGTGKTELSFQLARMTGRDIIEVKISDLRDKYVGEGQKHVQALFDRYRRVMKNSKKCPILLLNEADGFLTKRSENNDSTASKEENGMQNIFLREFEKFEGILIATTNLQNNFDPAFERRFLMKLRLSSPNEGTRAKIWKSLVKGLTDDDAKRLGKEFVISGGQIENCARRQMIDFILEGAETNYATLSKYAVEEIGYKKPHHTTIGFKVA